MKKIIKAILWFFLSTLLAIAGYAQTIPFPLTPVGGGQGNPGNPIKVPPDHILGGGYSGDWVVAQCQWGPCAGNAITKATWGDVISCTECAGGGGGRYLSSRCDTHQSVSMVFPSPQMDGLLKRGLIALGLASPSPTYIFADNYAANAGSGSCNSGPTGQFYRIDPKFGPSFVYGADVSPRAFAGFVGSSAYFSSSPGCQRVDIEAKTSTFGPCPASYDPKQGTDSQGNTWTEVASNSLKSSSTVASTPPALLTPSAAAPQSPTSAPKATASPTIGLPGATSTKLPSQTKTPTEKHHHGHDDHHHPTPTVTP